MQSNRMNTNFTLCLMLVLHGALNGINGHPHCYTDEQLAQDLQENPEIQQGLDDVEDHWKHNPNYGGKDGPITRRRLEVLPPIDIPVNIHIVRWVSSSDPIIGYEQIISQLAVLNRDFNKENPGVADGGNFGAIAADFNMKFSLNKIIRKSSWRSSWSLHDMKYTANGGSSSIDPIHCLNIWVTKPDVSNILGYATFPGVSQGIDGIVIKPGCFGNKNDDYRDEWNIQSSYNLGRTATHEVGHWLNLKHIWGNGDCGYDDYVSDTPTDDGPNYGCPNTVINSCGSADMWMNYMDYTDDDCMNMFSKGQLDRADDLFMTGGIREKMINWDDSAQEMFVNMFYFIRGSDAQCMHGDIKRNTNINEGNDGDELYLCISYSTNPYIDIITFIAIDTVCDGGLVTIDTNLNHGNSGTTLYVCYTKEDRDTNKSPLKDLDIKSFSNIPSSYITEDGYMLISAANLNEGSGSDTKIYLAASTPEMECAFGSDICDGSADCIDIVNGFTCSCKLGYEGDGITCNDIDECSAGTDNCDPNASCTNTAGGFSCECNPGYVAIGEGSQCIDDPELFINEPGYTTKFKGDITCDTQNLKDISRGADELHIYRFVSDNSYNSVYLESCASESDTWMFLYEANGEKIYDEDTAKYIAITGCSGHKYAGDIIVTTKQNVMDLYGTDSVTYSICRDSSLCPPPDPISVPNGETYYFGIGSYYKTTPGKYTIDLCCDCPNIDECVLGWDNCDENADCHEAADGAGFVCLCKSGYEGDGITCNDIDECAAGTCDPNASCTNTVGGFSCECNPGYVAIGEGPQCTDDPELFINEPGYTTKFKGDITCDTQNLMNISRGADELHIYRFVSDNSYNFVYLEGCASESDTWMFLYEPNGEKIYDEDTAKYIAITGCSGNQYAGDIIVTTKQNIMDLYGTDSVTYSICSDSSLCPPPDPISVPNGETYYFGIGAYDKTTPGKYTIDLCCDCPNIDECVLGWDNCDENADCQKPADGGGFVCLCKSGYEGDGIICNDIDECATGTDNCDPNASCTNTIGGFSCECNPGYVGDGIQCTADECALGWDNCDENADCTATVNGFTCSCKPGYEGDGITCNDIDECAAGTDNCDPNASCTNTIGGFSCECNQGYVGDGITCNDIDECTAGTDNCDPDAICTNTGGGFRCECYPGFVGDGTQCTAELDCTPYPSSSGTRREQCEAGNSQGDGYEYLYNANRGTYSAVCGKDAGCYCCRGIAGLVCTAYPSSSGTSRERCEAGNSHYDGFEYLYNANRGTDSAVCGKDAGCNCCRRKSELDCTAYPSSSGTSRERCEAGNSHYDGYEYVYNANRGTDSAVCGKDASCNCCRRRSAASSLSSVTVKYDGDHNNEILTIAVNSFWFPFIGLVVVVLLVVNIYGIWYSYGVRKNKYQKVVQ